ncbi:MAG: thioredoxin domain-containing protein, partial [Anaerolineae bacterium]|nr:thioredoxin domain-containing protein [Anaerolineae bacterium]
MTQKVKNGPNRSQQMMFLIGGIIVAAVLLLLLLISVQSGGTGEFDYSNYTGPVPQDTNDANLVLDGIPRTRTSDGAFIIGNPDARVTVVAFEDFLCSHCQSYQSTVKEFMRQYVATGQARFEFRMLPISQSSQSVFQVAECAGVVEPGMFWPVHDYLFQQASAGTLDSNSLISGPVGEFGLNRAAVL